MPPRHAPDDARSKSISIAELDTHGILNRHSQNHPNFQVGVAEGKGGRKTMEDAHSFVVDFDSIRGQGFFAVFDGHAGKDAAEWCGSHFHEYLLETLHANTTLPVPDVLNQTFHKVDETLSRMCEESDGKIHSGCTAVTAFLRIEDADGNQAFATTPASPTADSPVSSHGDDSALAGSTDSPPTGNSSENVSGTAATSPPTSASSSDGKHPKKKSTSTSRLRKALRSLGGGGSGKSVSSASSTPRSQSPSSTRKADSASVTTPPLSARRVLYSANAGDARGVLCRAGRAVRLTYDHKGTDKQEAKRITDAGGFVMSGRVNGVLAVTRSLGDSSMKEFVVGAPYTTETELCDDDEFLILACDGLWDVASDQAAIDLVRDELIRGTKSAQEASQILLQYAMDNRSMDNVTVVVVHFKRGAPRTA